MRGASWLVSFVTVAAALVACAAEKPVDPKFAEVAQIERTQCTKCHKRPEVGEKSREHLQTALTNHRKRVPSMTEDQWALMVDYLAADVR